MKLEKDQKIALGFLIFAVTTAVIIAYFFGVNDPDGRKGLMFISALAAISTLYLIGGSRFKQAADPISRQFSRAGYGPDLSPRQTRLALVLIAFLLLIGVGLVYFAISKPVF